MKKRLNQFFRGPEPEFRPTRWPELMYRNDAPGLWRFYDVTSDPPAAVGPHYRTKAELLADADRYAASFGL